MMAIRYDKIVDGQRQVQHESLDESLYDDGDEQGRDHSISSSATIAIRYDKAVDGQRQVRYESLDKSLYNDSDKV
jgi:hypothetical protein